MKNSTPDALASIAAPPMPKPQRDPLRLLMLIDGMEALTAGGTERQFLQLAQIARKNGVVPTIAILRDTEWLTSDFAGCEVKHFNLQSIKEPGGIREFLRLLRWMKRERFEILQNFFFDANLLGPFLGRMADIPVVIGTRRSLSDAYDYDKPLRRFFNRLRNHFVDRLLVNSEAVKRSVMEFEGVPSSKIEVIYNGLDMSAPRPSATAALQVRNELHILPGELLIGNVSGLRKVKGLETFVQAAALVRQRAEHLKFVIVGDGEMRPMLESMIAGHGLGNVVRLAGAQVDVAPFLAAMDIAVLCSHAEGLSNSLLEYMAYGLPVIATDVGGNREALGGAGLLIPANSPEALADGMERFIDPQRRETYGKAASIQARRFDRIIAEEKMGAHFAECRDRLDLLRSRRRTSNRIAGA